ncbi:hypothetical protein SASPL_152329 [Salvia splendens]|uniref:NAF domain-containing protein n=1 Tax=Salvia splendens TaxID=180675 RepID=A0A8X8W3E5_SALSN|nr:hypothetical protein SASPL_152329 [Salvia splendens]
MKHVESLIIVDVSDSRGCGFGFGIMRNRDGAGVHNMNAFDLISMTPGFDLSGLFEGRVFVATGNGGDEKAVASVSIARVWSEGNPASTVASTVTSTDGTTEAELRVGEEKMIEAPYEIRAEGFGGYFNKFQKFESPPQKFPKFPPNSRGRDHEWFTTREPPETVVSRLEELATTESFRIRKKDGVVKMQGGRKGQLGIDAEIYEVAPSFHMVEVKKSSGDSLSM